HAAWRMVLKAHTGCVEEGCGMAAVHRRQGCTRWRRQPSEVPLMPPTRRHAARPDHGPGGPPTLAHVPLARHVGMPDVLARASTGLALDLRADGPDPVIDLREPLADDPDR